ncbi:MAG: hypothetical protein M1834_004639 [Cirrosporium novae-zelandiae]|nr:MAG: hypothetical protein M1834_004639 [Cirrosporium novae-zelandiae]
MCFEETSLTLSSPLRHYGATTSPESNIATTYSRDIFDIERRSWMSLFDENSASISAGSTTEEISLRNSKLVFIDLGIDELSHLENGSGSEEGQKEDRINSSYSETDPGTQTSSGEARSSERELIERLYSHFLNDWVDENLPESCSSPLDQGLASHSESGSIVQVSETFYDISTEGIGVGRVLGSTTEGSFVEDSPDSSLWVRRRKRDNRAAIQIRRPLWRVSDSKVRNLSVSQDLDSSDSVSKILDSMQQLSTQECDILTSESDEEMQLLDWGYQAGYMSSTICNTESLQESEDLIDYDLTIEDFELIAKAGFSDPLNDSSTKYSDLDLSASSFDALERQAIANPTTEVSKRKRSSEDCHLPRVRRPSSTRRDGKKHSPLQTKTGDYHGRGRGSHIGHKAPQMHLH